MRARARIISGIIAAVMCMQYIAGIVVFADNSTDWEYNVIDGGVEITGYTGSDIDIFVPAEIDGKPVVKIGNEAFKNKTSLNSVNLSENVQSIGISAFEGATGMVCIVTNDALKEIGDRAFAGCTSFNSVILGDNVTSFGIDAFENCDKISIYCNENSAAHIYAQQNNIEFRLTSHEARPEIYNEDGITYYATNGNIVLTSCDIIKAGEVVIPATVKGYPVTSIAQFAFRGCEDITKITMPDSIVSIGDEAFQNCHITEIELSRNLKTMGNLAFSYSDIEEITVPNSVSSIGDSAFAHCSELKTAALPDGLTNISTSLFFNDISLETVYVPNSVTVIYKDAFSQCENLQQIQLPGELTEIRESAFKDCTSLKNISIPSSVKKIQGAVFSNCISLESVVLPEDLTFIDEETFYNCTNLSQINIPKNLEKILDSAFFNCSMLPETLVLPPSVVSIGYMAFSQTNISSLNISSPSIDIGEQAFSNTHISEISLSSNIFKIPPGTFQGCSDLTSVDLPNGVEAIYDQAFAYCTNLRRVKIPASVETISNNAFLDSNSVILYVYENSYAHQFAQNNDLPYKIITSDDDMGELYQIDGLNYLVTASEATVVGYYDISNGIVIHEEVNGCPVTEIGANAFSQCYLGDLEIPSSIKTIESKAFSGADIGSIQFNDGLKKIGSEAFANSRISSVQIPAGVEEIGSGAFKQSAIKSILIGEGVTEIPDQMLYECSQLQEIVLPGTIEKIGNDVFYNCFIIENITLPDKVKNIGERAFYGCGRLRTIKIPDAVSAIESNVFNGCRNLKSVHLPKSIKRIENGAFGFCESLFIMELPEETEYINNNAFNNSYIILCVYENSYAERYAIRNSLPYHVISSSDDMPLIVENDGITYGIIDDSATILKCDMFKYGDVEIPERVEGYPVTEVAQDAFSNCSQIESIELPETIVSIGKNSFSLMQSLQNIALPAGLKSIGASAFSGCYDLKTIQIPASVEILGHGTFGGCISMQSVDIFSSSIDSIPNGMFSNCDKLERVNMPDSIQTIGAQAFAGCTSLKIIDLPANLKTIGDSAFCNSGLIEIDLPQSVQKIGESVFESCTELVDAKIDCSIKEIPDRSFSQTQIKSITIPDSVTSIGMVAFMSCHKLEEISFSKSLRTIKYYAFEDCESLKTVELPNTVQNVEHDAFINCTGLTKVVLSSGMNVIDDATFKNTNITSIAIPDSVTEIGSEAFQSCKNLENIVFPVSLKTIGHSAFEDCEALNAIEIPEMLKTIGERAFFGCTGITELKIPKNIKYVGMNAFGGDVNLEKVKIQEGASGEFGQAVFSECKKIKFIVIPKDLSIYSDKVFDRCTAVVCVHEDSVAHRNLQGSDCTLYVIPKSDNPHASDGQSVQGFVTGVNGWPKDCCSVELLDKYGTVRGTVNTDHMGFYEFTYVEVGSYTIRATDLRTEAVGTDNISIKRKSLDELYLAGNTNITIRVGATLYGYVTNYFGDILTDASVTLVDSEGMPIKTTVTDEKGTYTINNVPNGSFSIRVEKANYSAIEEISVYTADEDYNFIQHDIAINQGASVRGRVIDAEGNPIVWAEIIVTDTGGERVASLYTDKDGGYEIDSLPLGSYSITALFEDINTKLSGVASVDITSTESVTVDTITVIAEKTSIGTATINGKVTAHGQKQICTVILRDVFLNEIAICNTSENGKYKFTNIADGVYTIIATTESEGAGLTSVVIKDGELASGNTSITVYKTGTVDDFETQVAILPEVNADKSTIKSYESSIIKANNTYNSLSQKDKKRVSSGVVDKLNGLIEILASSVIEINDTGAETYEPEVKGLETVISDEEINGGLEAQVSLDIAVIDTENIEDEAIVESVQQLDEKAENEEMTIVEYFDIDLTKSIEDAEKEIKNITKDSVGTGKVQITMTIPKEERGHENYTMIHLHNGEVTTLVDIDKDPATVTFETDKFSQFALAYDDNVRAESNNIESSIAYDSVNKAANITSDQIVKNAQVIFAAYEGGCLKSLQIKTVDLAEGINEPIPADNFDTTGSDDVKVMVWYDLIKMTPVFDD